MSLTVWRLLDPSEEEVVECVEVLVLAFRQAYENLLHVLNGDCTLIQPLVRAYVDDARVGGQLWVATLGDKGIVGVALWYGPGTLFLDSKEQREAGWNEVMARLPKAQSQWWEDYMAAYSTARATVLGADVVRDAYHLWTLGVHPDHQRKGVAKALQQTVEDIAREHQLAMVVEANAERNVAVYEGLGFKTMGSIKYMKANGEEGTIWEFIKWP